VVRATVGLVVTALVDDGDVGASVEADVTWVVGCVVMSCGATISAAARVLRMPPARAASAHRKTTAAGRDIRTCLLRPPG
jgi:hypothetical protein